MIIKSEDYKKSTSDYDLQLAEQGNYVTAGILSTGMLHEFNSIISNIQLCIELGLSSKGSRDVEKAFNLISTHIDSAKDKLSSLSQNLSEHRSIESKNEHQAIIIPDSLHFFLKILRSSLLKRGISLETRKSVPFKFKTDIFNLCFITTAILEESAKAMTIYGTKEQKIFLHFACKNKTLIIQTFINGNRSDDPHSQLTIKSQ
jgi:hypothetical protein